MIYHIQSRIYPFQHKRTHGEGSWRRVGEGSRVSPVLSSEADSDSVARCTRYRAQWPALPGFRLFFVVLNIVSIVYYFAIDRVWRTMYLSHADISAEGNQVRHTFQLTPKSSNVKTGPIPVSTTSAESCPMHCPFKGNGCYAASGPLALHWKAVTSGTRGTDLATFCNTIAALPEGQLWRHNQAGDLPGQDDRLDAEQVRAIVAANTGRKGFTYTHYVPDSHNAPIIAECNRNGFTVNLSADNLAEADAMKALHIGPVTVVLPSDAKENVTTPAGNLVVICPATQRDDVSCATCKLCAWGERDVIIGFPAHGSGKKKASAVASKLVTIGGAQ